MNTVRSIAETLSVGLSRAEEIVHQSENSGELALLAVELESIMNTTNALSAEAKERALSLYYAEETVAA